MHLKKIGIHYFNGTYEEYLEHKEKSENNIVPKKVSTNHQKNTKNTYFEEKEKAKRKNKINKLEQEIEEKENDIKNIESEMQSEEMCTDYIKLKELQDNIESIQKEIEAKMIEWEELSKEE